MRIFAAIVAASLLASPVARAEPAVDASAPAEAEKPDAEPPSWHLDDVLPPWLHVALAHRVRYAYTAEQFRAGRPGGGGLLNLRTNLAAELRLSPFRVGGELIDSRAYLGNDATAPNTGIVNAMGLLQGYAGVDLPVGDATVAITAGRMTMDVGSRRLIARNRFRNTINNFTGVDVQLEGPDLPTVRGFVVLPVERLPTEPARVERNAVVFDRESFGVILSGLFVSTPTLGLGLQAEAYAIQLTEHDAVDRPTRNRRLVTPGFRLHREPAAGELDVEVEATVQIGQSRATSRDDDVTDLRHFAAFQHAQVGYTIDTVLSPRLIAQYDHATGDGSPDDDRNGRYDTLYGARRWEYGPTGIYGALARSNIRSPGFRVQLKPHATVKGFVGWRAAWLASRRDAWTTARLRDPTGGSGSFVGHQLEGRVRFEPFPRNLRLEVGAAHLFPGSFLDRVPDANPDTATTMIYGQVTGSI